MAELNGIVRGESSKIAQQTIDKDKIYNITDIEGISLTNAQMTAAITSAQEGIIKPNAVYMCSDNGTYTKDKFYRFTVNYTTGTASWIEVSVGAPEVLKGTTDPTTATVGVVGQFYIDTSADPAELYLCTKVDTSTDPATYTWTKQKDYSNPNLLINGDFRVNQRGLTTYDHSTAGSSGYTVDRWWSAVGATIVVNNDGSITVKNASGTTNRHLIQYFEDYTKLLGQTVTFSMKVTDAVQGDTWKVALYDGSTLYGETTGTYSNNGENVVTATITMSSAIGSGRTKLGLIVYPRQTAVSNDTITIKYIKLEVGSVATAFSPKPYVEELAMCQRYYQKLEGYRYINTSARTVAQMRGILTYTCEMRAEPTLTQLAVLNLYDLTASADANQSAIGIASVTTLKTTSAMVALSNYSGLTLGNIYIPNTATKIFELDAEIY